MVFSANSPVMEGAITLLNMGQGFLKPYEYTGWKSETTAPKTSAYISVNLSNSPICDVSGPDAVAFLNSICVNDFSTLKPDGIRHAILCNEKGQILTDGVVIPLSENTFRTYWLNPVLNYFLEKTTLDVAGKDMSNTEYFIQIAGEKSLELLEDATGQKLEDIPFAKHRVITVGDKKVRILRLGMTGNLAYEAHGPMEDFYEIYEKIWAAGKKVGAKKLGMHSYSAFSHTEGGFPNIHIHYPMPWFENADMARYLASDPGARAFNDNIRLWGSVGADRECRYVTPYDVGWGKKVKFNHEFTGRAALEKLAQDPPRTVVTLEWNAEDVGKVFTTLFEGDTDQACEDISEPNDMCFLENCMGAPEQGHITRADKVMCNGQWIGISTGRIRDEYYKTMISLAFIAPQYAVEGTELTLVWGTPGTHQMEIRVKVARYPYIDKEKNNQASR